ncbi:phage tail protein [Leuconostoc mesenteroides]|uniref:phage tail protein n=1 Tax=Leuconostoc mesenteroides TaxID=1245 RepID=UPI00236003DF|nr:phage tail protein [Leuconostoc mesenteroides]
MSEYNFFDLSKRTDVEIEKQISEGFKFGEFDSTDHDLFLISRDAPSPDSKDIRESVPYMQGVYDFSTLTNGERYFENRTITYEMMLFNQEYSDRKVLESDVKRQLVPLGIQPLYDTHDKSFHWFGKVDGISFDDDEKMRTLKVTITFNVYPFAIGNNSEGSDIWDDVYFPNWIFQDTEFTVNGTQSITLYNIGSRSVKSKIKVNGTIEVSGDFGSFELSNGTYDSTQLVLGVGTNVLTLSGNGTIKFVFYREEMI